MNNNDLSNNINNNFNVLSTNLFIKKIELSVNNSRLSLMSVNKNFNKLNDDINLLNDKINKLKNKINEFSNFKNKSDCNNFILDFEKRSDLLIDELSILNQEKHRFESLLVNQKKIESEINIIEELLSNKSTFQINLLT